MSFLKKFCTMVILLLWLSINSTESTSLDQQFFMKNKKSKHMLLFEQFPSLATKIAHVKLGTFPTLIKKLSTLETPLSCSSLYLKDDGKTGLLFGGNKVRKLEFLLADALQKRAEYYHCWRSRI